jgi:transcriptional regulator with PAS, ATPase and Fis domain
VKCRLDARVSYLSRDARGEEPVTVSELSLSGALISGLSSELRELFSIRLSLPGNDGVELLARAVRSVGSDTAIRLFHSDKHAMQALWDYIKVRLILDDSCPYCDCPQAPKVGRCRKCGMYLNVTHERYLERHVENTFAQRLGIRLSKLNLEYAQKIMHFVDTKLLNVQHRSPDSEFIGASAAMLAVFSMIRKVAPTEMNVLILGESGTGKELTAKALHRLSARKDGPFVAVNCAAIPESLLEAELFGHEKGAFTGALATKQGKFEVADGGTLFLDEIGDLTPTLQAKLLRFLEDRLVERVGSNVARKVELRIVAATNSDLQRAMDDGRFRPDLYYRLNSFTITLPPLRERGEDKVLLARHFLRRAAHPEQGVRDFSNASLEAIRRHPWPGNVRELENRVKRGCLMATGELIDPASMELDERSAIIRLPGRETKETRSHREIVTEALERNGYVIAKAARELNISRPSMYALIKKYGIRE